VPSRKSVTGTVWKNPRVGMRSDTTMAVVVRTDTVAASNRPA
jgi:hypothetical protein